MTKKTIRNRQRKKSRRHIDALYNEQRGLCHWCKKPTVIRKKDYPTNVISDKHGVLIWQENGIVFEAKLATIDHVQRLADGGSHKRENIVLSCYECNQEQNKKYQKKDISKRICPDCGRRRCRKRNKCDKCRLKINITFLLNNNWVQCEPNKFQDFLTGETYDLKSALALQGNRHKESVIRSI